jgi:putative transposase
MKMRNDYKGLMPRRRKRHVQVELEFVRHGGRRVGAGRKRTAARPRVPHTRRPDLDPRHPIHVTLRVLDSVGMLRRRAAFKVVRSVMVDMLGRDDLRIVDLSIQSNHIHLICEAASREALSAGMKSFKIATARRLNRTLGREGFVFADRYHAESLTCPRQVRAAIAYVLNNWRRHREDRFAKRVVDEFSTGMWFNGWKEARIDVPPGLELLPRREPRTWLLSVGWKKASPISLFEVPGPRAKA